MLEEGDVEPLAGGSGMPQKSVKAQEMHTMFRNRFCCDVCGMTFRTLTLLRQHKEASKEQRSFVCRICSVNFSVFGGLKQHVVSHHRGEDILKCAVCQKGFNHLQTFLEHVREHAWKSTHSCCLCPMVFVSADEAERHSRLHNILDNFLVTSILASSSDDFQSKCEICHKSFSSDLIFKKHMLSHCESHTVDHGLLTPVPVEDLQETSLKLLDNFAMDSNRSIASPFGQVPCDTEIKNNAECDVCHKVLGRNHSMAFHRIFHLVGMGMQCPFCLKNYGSKPQLRVHLRYRHMGDIKLYESKGYTLSNLSAEAAVPQGYCQSELELLTANDEPGKPVGSSVSHEEPEQVGQSGEQINGSDGPDVKPGASVARSRKCHVCHKVLKGRELLSYHCLIEHSGFMNMQCPFCMKRYVGREMLVKHLCYAHKEDVRLYEANSFSLERPGVSHQCHKCHKLFQNRAGLASHLRYRVCKLVDIEELGAEDKCRKERDTNLEELEADRLHLNDNDIKGQTCILCNKVLRKNWKMLFHLIIDHSGCPVQLQCRFCMAKLQSRSSLVHHLRLCHKPELLKFQEESPYVNAAAGSLFRSKICNKGFTKNKSIKENGRGNCEVAAADIVNNSDSDFQPELKQRCGDSSVCHICKQTVNATVRMAYHHIIDHSPYKGIKCPFCLKKFVSEKRLVAHLSTVHEKDVRRFERSGFTLHPPKRAEAWRSGAWHKSFGRRGHPLKSVQGPCAAAPKGTIVSSRKLGKLHESTTKKVSCQVCNKSLKNNSKIIYHYIIDHHKGPRFQCLFCQKMSVNRGMLVRHLRSVHKPEVTRLEKSGFRGTDLNVESSSPPTEVTRNELQRIAADFWPRVVLSKDLSCAIGYILDKAKSECDHREAAVSSGSSCMDAESSSSFHDDTIDDSSSSSSSSEFTIGPSDESNDDRSSSTDAEEYSSWSEGDSGEVSSDEDAQDFSSMSDEGAGEISSAYDEDGGEIPVWSDEETSSASDDTRFEN